MDSSFLARDALAVIVGLAIFALGKNQKFSQRFPFILVSLAALSATVVVVIAVLRSFYPQDLLVWSESPLLTDALKLRNGEDFFQSPALANSFVYTPGIVYADYELLRPFGLDVSITAHRLLIVGYSGLSALCLALTVRETIPENRGWIPTASMFFVFVVVLHTNVTADTLHPDSLHTLIVAATFLLTVLALRRKRFDLAVAAILLGALGVFSKQTAGVLAPLSAACFIVSGDFSRRQKWMLGVGAAALSAAALGAVFSMPFARFYTFDVLRAHPVFFSKLVALPRQLAVGNGAHGWWLVALVALLGLRVRWRRDRQWTIVWLAFLIVAGGSNLPAFLKAMGAPNNLTLLHVLMVAGALPLLLERSLVANDRRYQAAVLGIVLLSLPLKSLTNPDRDRYASELQAAVSQSLAKHERLLVAHGASALIAAGHREVPFDRANSVIELRWAGMVDMTETRARIAKKAYDRIIMNSAWYGPEIEAEVLSHYRAVGTIRAAAGGRFGYPYGWQAGLLQDVTIFVRKAEAN